MDVVEFWSKLSKQNGEDGCWEWTGYRTQAMGYGRVKFSGKVTYAHRVAYELAKGAIPIGMCVCHSCDNPACCNPTHLWLGTRAENIADRDAKGRHSPVRSDGTSSAKLNWGIVRSIRISYCAGERISALAVRFGVVRSNIWAVVHNKTWFDPEYTPPH